MPRHLYAGYEHAARTELYKRLAVHRARRGQSRAADQSIVLVHRLLPSLLAMGLV